MRRSRKRLLDSEVDGPLQPDPAIAESLIDQLLPASHAEADWSVREVARLAVQARLAGDIAAAVAAHRLLADVLGSTRGGYAARHGDEAIDEAEAEAAILQAADIIRARRGLAPA
jgi:hypothetical protein